MLARETRVTLLSVEGAVRESIEHMAGDLTRADLGAVKLAQVYARDIDARSELVDVIGALRRALLDAEDNPSEHGLAYQLGGAVDRLIRQLAEGKLLADVGPKLLAALESLGATPAARARIAGAKPTAPVAPVAGDAAAKPATPRASALDRLRKADGGATVIMLHELDGPDA